MATTARPISLITTPDSGAAIAAADSLLPGRTWTATAAQLGDDGHASPLELSDWARHRVVLDGGMRCVRVMPDRRVQLAITVAAPLATLLCARQFGGRAANAQRVLGQVERGVASDFALAVARDLGAADWTVPTNDAAIDDDIADAAASGIDVLSRTAMVAGIDLPKPHLVMTLAGALSSTHSPVPVDWDDRLAVLVRAVRLPIRTVLARPLLSAGEIVRLRIGDVIPIRSPGRVTLLAGTHRLAVGTLIERDGHAAVAIEPHSVLQS